MDVQVLTWILGLGAAAVTAVLSFVVREQRVAARDLTEVKVTMARIESQVEDLREQGCRCAEHCPRLKVS